MKIAVGCDPNATEYKKMLIPVIEGLGHEVTDFGSDDPIYANVAIEVGEAVAAKKYDRGILFCGTGIGVMLAANKVKGVRACVCSEPYTAKFSKMHNNSNIIAFGARVVGSEMAKMIVDTWMETEYEGGRHQRRVDLLDAIEG